MKAPQVVSSGLGIGYMGKGGGTVAAFAACLAWYGLILTGGAQKEQWLPVVTVIITGLGIWSANAVEPDWGKDDKKVVIDEIAGMCTSLLFIPLNLFTLVAALILFRFFDIVKPFYIRKLEKIKGGLGVMLDDVAAGMYANLVLQLLLYFQLI
jgi:phosphatidylglycerophosphatase A